MSFKFELESFIAEASLSLQDLELLLRQTQSWCQAQETAGEIRKEDIKDLHGQIDAVRQRVSKSLQQIQSSFYQERQRLSGLEDELKADIENIKEYAIDCFIRGQYKECVGLLSFLCKVQPDDEELERFLELSRQKQLESENAASEAAVDPDLNTKPGLKEGRSQDPSPGESPTSVAAVQADVTLERETPLAEVRNTTAVDPRARAQTEAREANGRETREPTRTATKETTRAGAGTAVESNVTLPERDRSAQQVAWVRQALSVEIDKRAEPVLASRPKRRALLVAVILALLAALLLLFPGYQRKSLTGDIEIRSEPTGANVFVDGVFLGQTQLSKKSMKAGKYKLRIEKEGYATWDQEFQVREKQPTLLSIRLEKLEPSATNLTSLREQAQALFLEGKLSEAALVCDAILEKDAQDAFALQLKENIGKMLAQQTLQAELVEQSKEMEAKLQDLQKSSALDLRPQTQLKVREAQPKEVYRPTNSGSLSSYGSVALKPETPSSPTTLSAGGSANQSPVSSPKSSATSATTSPEKAPRVSPEAIAELRTRIQAKEFDQAKALLGKLGSEFPGDSELKTLSESLKAEVTKQQSLAQSWVQKAETALIAGHYVTPPDDNVLVYCNRALASDPRNQRALSLKGEIVGRTVTQAKDWIQRGKFDAARVFYASLDYHAVNDNQFPYSKAELKQELGRLEFKNYPVVHEHKMGHCSGKLRINAYAVSFAPSGNSGDGFTEDLKSVIANEEGERLRISFRDKSFRFHPNLESKKANWDAVKTMYRHLINSMAR